MAHRIDKSLINKSELGRRVGISQSYVSLILDGKRTGPKAQKHLKKIKEEIQLNRAA
jgi:hypothetical protein